LVYLVADHRNRPDFSFRKVSSKCWTRAAGDFILSPLSKSITHLSQSNIEAEYQGGVAFMEYDRRYPHEKYTLGFAGRGGANGFYISVENNTMAHGPGTDRGGKDPEADTVFGRVLPESNGVEIVQQMKKQPGGSKPNGFIHGAANMIDIISLKLLTQREARAVREMFPSLLTASPPRCQETEEWRRIKNILPSGDERATEAQVLLPAFCSEFVRRARTDARPPLL
jgi:hypothetical protein